MEKNKDRQTGLFVRLTHWRWRVPLLVTVSFLILEAVEHWLVPRLAPPIHAPAETGLVVVELLLLILLFPFMLWWGLTSLRESIRQTEAVEKELRETNAALEGANQRLEFLSEVNYRLASAPDTYALHDEISRLAFEVSGAIGCAAILFDERGKPARTSTQGELSVEMLSEWESHIARYHEEGEVCEGCTDKTGLEPADCPLIRFQPEHSAVRKVFCLALSHRSQHFGIINLFYEVPGRPGPDERMLLESLAVEMSLALEIQSLRARELETLYRLENIRWKENLRDSLGSLLVNLLDAFEANGGEIFLFSERTGDLESIAAAGRASNLTPPLIAGLTNSALEAGKPLVVNDPSGDDAGGKVLKSLLIAPIRTEYSRIGVLVLRAHSPVVFNRRRTRTLALIAGQISLLIENHRLFVEAERKATRAERSRLGREIHDGLAQTLSYLKLRSSQVEGWLENGQVDRARQELGSIRELLAEAYTDTREAIDGLRIHPETGDDTRWIHQIAEEFQSLSGIPVDLELSPAPAVPLEVHYQLQRIIQEALSNVRKHARATGVCISWKGCSEHLSIRISDNGRGFDLNDVPPIARHGMRIMRERAELLGATIEFDSGWEQGTRIDLTLPLYRQEVADG
jgi:two-component system nitrate/nitrite sensor histidine kinase NarX